MSSKPGKRPLRSLTAHEKLDAIRRVHDGESKASVARDIGVPESTLRGWCKNEDKISYLSRQSSPETEDSIPGEPKEKKQKVDEILQPYNLSLKAAAYNITPNSSDPTDLSSKSDAADKSKIAADLSMKADTPKSSTHISERERNRAELARLSVELGLNRPEVFLPNLKTTATSNSSGTTDLGSNIGLLAQWNNILLQQQLLQSGNNKKVTAAPADTSSNLVSSSGGLLTTTTKLEEQKKLPKMDNKQPSVEDSVWYWLKTQQAMLMASNPTSTAAPNGSSSNGTPDQNHSWFWKWYKQFAYQQQAQLPTPDKPILYQQLTKSKDTENTTEEKLLPPVKSSSKSRAVLDNLLLNNNNVVANSTEVLKNTDNLLSSQAEALEHGEKLLQWLDTCSVPSITAMQIMQFRYLLNNIRSDIDRKNGEAHNKAKVRRK